MKLGIHASVRQGFLNAFKEAARLRCPALQIFPRRPRRPVPSLAHSEIEELLRFRKENAIETLIAHAVYQPNIASLDEKIRERSLQSLIGELNLAQSIGAVMFVIHAGSYSPGSNMDEGIRRSAETIRSLLEQSEPGTRIVIENVGGGERRIGGRFEELRKLLNEIDDKERAGICLDTAHAFAAGYAIQTNAGMDDCLAEFDKRIGLTRLCLFHLNDSGGEFGSHKDIHKHVGEGLIGVEPLRKLTRDPRFENVAGILETPGFPLDSSEKNLEQLR